MENKFIKTIAILASLAILTYGFTSLQSIKGRYDLSQRQIITLRAEALPTGQNTLSSVEAIVEMPEGELKILSQHTSKSGTTHTRYLHTIEGLRVYRSYIKAASQDNGQIIQIKYRVPKTKMRKRAATLTEEQAIDCAVKENFGRPKPKEFFSSPPTAEKVYFETHKGLLQVGYDVQNWSARSNMLYYTLVDGRSGKIIENVLRTNHAS